jgi:putative ABC transport system permease protein
MIIRLPDEVSLAQAQQRIDVLARGFQETNPTSGGWGVRLEPLDSPRATRGVRQGLFLLAGAVFAMLLIALVNGVNLLHVRGTARAREIGVRLAIGASRSRVFRQLLTESLVLALLSGGVAVLLARLAVDVMLGIMPAEVLFFSGNRIQIDDRVLAYAFGLSVVMGLAFGALPALRLARWQVSTSAAKIDASASSSAGRGRVRSGLVIAEISLSMTLLVSAGLLNTSFMRLVSVDPGFDPRNLAFLGLNLNADTHSDAGQRHAFFAEVRERIAGLPAVVDVTMAERFPPRGSRLRFGVRLEAEGGGVLSGEDGAMLLSARVEPDYFQVLGVPLLAGRVFSDVDTRETKSVIVDRDLATALWVDENPVGKRMRVGAEGPWRTVVGVVGDVKLMGQGDPWGTLAWFEPLPRGTSREVMSFAVRTSGDPRAVMPAIRDAVWQMDPHQPITRLETGRQALAASVGQPRFLLILMVVFASVALALAAIGVYGVLSFSVSQRARELGIRVALGAGTGSLERLVLRHGLVMASTGTVLGLGGALAVSQVIRSSLFEIEPTHPGTMIAVSAVMIGTALLACYFPARRATKVDPMQVLKAE